MRTYFVSLVAVLVLGGAGPWLHELLAEPPPVVFLGFQPADVTDPHEWHRELLPELLRLSHPDLLDDSEGYGAAPPGMPRFRVLYDLRGAEEVELRWQRLGPREVVVEDGAHAGDLSQLPELVSRIGRQISGQKAVRGSHLARPTDEAASVLQRMREGLRRFETVQILEDFFPDLPDWPQDERVDRLMDVLPGHPWIHQAASEALFDLGYEAEARELMERVVQGASSLDHGTRLCLLAELFRTRLAWSSAAVLDQSRWPEPGCSGLEEVDLGRRLARSLGMAGWHGAAIRLLEGRPADPWGAGIAAAIHLRVADRDAAIDAAQSAVDEAPPGSLLAARSHLLLGEAFRLAAEQVVGPGVEEALGRAEAELEKALAIYSDKEHPRGRGESARQLGAAAALRGDVSGARRRLREAGETFAVLPNRRGLAEVSRRLGLLGLTEGDLEAAVRAQEEALEAFRDLGDAQAEAAILADLIPLYNRLGWLSQAARSCQRADTLTAHFPADGVRVQHGCGHLERLRGALPTARHRLERGLAMAIALDDASAELSVSRELLDVLRLSGEIDTARDRLEALGTPTLGERAAARARSLQAVLMAAGGDDAPAERALRRTLGTLSPGQVTGPGLVDLTFAELALAALLVDRVEAGDDPEILGEAEALAGQARQSFERHGHPIGAWRARQLEARIALRRGAAEEARRQLDELGRWREEARITASEIVDPALPAELLDALVRIAEGDRTARQRLEVLLARSVRLGWRPLELETRLALGELELRQGRESKARRRLESLAEEARLEGFALVARKAGALLPNSD